tara:strand:- start:689 stop:1339 length:651 start_codon:yes stop_codon:yes gene_type:complete
MSFEELLKQAGLDQYQQYFGQTGQEVAGALGFEGQQAEQFARFFQPFDQARLEQGAQEIQQRQATRTGFLQSDFDSGFRGLTTQLGQATRQIGQAAGQSGFTRAGATARQIGEARERVGESMQDLMLGRQRGMFQIEQQAGQERAGLTGLLQNYLTGAFRRGEQIARLDPTSQSQPARQRRRTANEIALEIQQNNPGMDYSDALRFAEQDLYEDRL